jgi:putative phage-type endonuclease
MLNNQDFARLRTKSLGGSDIGAMLGLSKYRSAVDVWLEKTGQVTQQRDSLPLRFGQHAESFVAEEYAKATGASLIHDERTITHPEHPFLTGHVDRYIQGDRPEIFNAQGQVMAPKILECKTAHPFLQSEWGDVGTDQVPLPYLVQCQWYLMLTQCETADLAVLFANSDFRIYTIHRDTGLEQLLLERALSFWHEHVLTGQPPKIQNDLDCRNLFPRARAGQTIEASVELITKLQELKMLESQIKTHESVIAQIKTDLMEHMGEAETLQYQGNLIATWKSPKPTTKLDSKRLSLEHPDLVLQYQQVIPNTRRLVIKEISHAPN